MTHSSIAQEPKSGQGNCALEIPFLSVGWEGTLGFLAHVQVPGPQLSVT